MYPQRLRYPPDFDTVDFGQYVNCGFRPECTRNQSDFVVRGFTDAMRDNARSALALLSANSEAQLQKLTLDKSAYRVADYFTPAYGWTFRQNIADILLQRNNLLARHALGQNVQAPLDANVRLFADVLGARHPDPQVRQNLVSKQRAMLDALKKQQSASTVTQANDLGVYLFREFLA